MLKVNKISNAKTRSVDVILVSLLFHRHLSHVFVSSFYKGAFKILSTIYDKASLRNGF